MAYTRAIVHASKANFMRVLLTGGAGFIGYHVATALLVREHAVTALDNFNAYYDPALKKARLGQLAEALGERELLALGLITAASIGATRFRAEN